METIKRELPNGKLEGECDARFRGVLEEFERNFTERGEVGASACLTLGGHTVVDLWGGLARPAERVPWPGVDNLLVPLAAGAALTLLGHR